MKNSTKIVILSILGILGLAVAILLNSVWITAGVIIILMGTAIGINLLSSYNSKQFYHYAKY